MIGFCSQSNDDNLTSSTAPKRKDVKIPGIPETKKDPDAPPAQKDPRVADDIMEIFIQEDDDDDADEAKVHSFEIEYSKTEDLKHHLLSSNPVVEEYDFKNDKENPNLDLDLKPSTIIRPYQEKSLSKMFGDGLVGFHKFGWFFCCIYLFCNMTAELALGSSFCLVVLERHLSESQLPVRLRRASWFSALQR